MRSWKFWLGVLVSAFFVFWTARGLEWSSFFLALRHANYWWLLPGIAIYFGAVWARTWRWHYMLRHLKPVSLRRLFPVVVIGYMGNNVYPLRAGEVIRSYVLRRNEGINISASLATVALERLFDGLVMTVFVFATLPFLPLPPQYRSLVFLCSGLFGMALLVFLGLAAWPEHANALIFRFVSSFVPLRFRTQITDVASRFLEGLHSLRSPREVLMIVVTSVAIWLTETTKYWVVTHAFAGLHVPFTVLMLMTAVVNLATMIPSAPGYVGTFDKPGIQVLVSVGKVRANIAAAYTLVLHVALWLPITLLGLFYMSRQSLHWHDIDVAVEAQRQQAEPEVQLGVPPTVNTSNLHGHG
ncbi:MAG: flippase-like domain-containing protein [Herpetosiphonaceae bacterium]|nr:flippase-like domain-containing protein [Herpetosiphonaceae bacterium]